jgi:hypothetical protein
VGVSPQWVDAHRRGRTEPQVASVLRRLIECPREARSLQASRVPSDEWLHGPKTWRPACDRELRSASRRNSMRGL